MVCLFIAFAQVYSISEMLYAFRGNAQADPKAANTDAFGWSSEFLNSALWRRETPKETEEKSSVQEWAEVVKFGLQVGYAVVDWSRNRDGNDPGTDTCRKEDLVGGLPESVDGRKLEDVTTGGLQTLYNACAEDYFGTATARCTKEGMYRVESYCGNTCAKEDIERDLPRSVSMSKLEDVSTTGSKVLRACADDYFGTVTAKCTKKYYENPVGSNYFFGKYSIESDCKNTCTRRDLEGDIPDSVDESGLYNVATMSPKPVYACATGYFGTVTERCTTEGKYAVESDCRNTCTRRDLPQDEDVPESVDKSKLEFVTTTGPRVLKACAKNAGYFGTVTVACTLDGRYTIHSDCTVCEDLSSSWYNKREGCEGDKMCVWKPHRWWLGGACTPV